MIDDENGDHIDVAIEAGEMVMTMIHVFVFKMITIMSRTKLRLQDCIQLLQVMIAVMISTTAATKAGMTVIMMTIKIFSCRC